MNSVQTKLLKLSEVLRKNIYHYTKKNPINTFELLVCMFYKTYLYNVFLEVTHTILANVLGTIFITCFDYFSILIVKERLSIDRNFTTQSNVYAIGMTYTKLFNVATHKIF